MTRRCSHCSSNGHNSRTCSSRSGGVWLFGVQLAEGAAAMKKSASMGCLSTSAISSSEVAGASVETVDAVGEQGSEGAAGYASDDPNHASCSMNCRTERKKGVPWTEEEHRMFLLGLQKLGKGDWRGIARNYVVSRTPTQVASHAQKYFIRQSTTRRKRRSSLFDMVPEMPPEQVAFHEEQFLPLSPSNELEKTRQLPTLHLGQQQEPELVELMANITPGIGERIECSNTQVVMVPTFYPAFVPVPSPFWAPSTTMIGKEIIVREEMMAEGHEILKPTPVLRKEPVNMDEVVTISKPVNMDEVVTISKLSINERAANDTEPSMLSLKLQGPTLRKSAFHINSSAISGPDLNQSSGNPIHAV